MDRDIYGFNPTQKLQERIYQELEKDIFDRGFVGPIFGSARSFSFSDGILYDKVKISYENIIPSEGIYYSFEDLDQIDNNYKLRNPAMSKIWEFQDYYKIPRTDSCKLDRLDTYSKKRFLLDLISKHYNNKEQLWKMKILVL